jgi:flagellar basal body-associated protein FliL
MANIDQDAALSLDEPRGRSPLLKWGLIGAIMLLVLGAGGAVWYFELKPFVVSMASTTGTSHFVQLGLSLQVPRAAAGEMITAVLPEVQDAMRQTLLGYKSDELQNTDGVNKVRQALLKHLNEVLARVLGPDRVAKITDGQPNRDVVQNILFATLIIE